MRVIAGITTADDVTRANLDSHADIACFGHNAMLVDPGTHHVLCFPFMKSLGVAVDISIVTAAVAFDQPNTGNTLILIYHQALWFGAEMDVNLINSNQMRMNGLVVNKCPKHLLPETPTSSTHTLFCLS
jgi:hypothetical protein